MHVAALLYLLNHVAVDLERVDLVNIIIVVVFFPQVLRHILFRITTTEFIV